MADLRQKLADNIVGYVIIAVMGAALVVVMQSSGRDARLTAIENQHHELTQQVAELQRSMSNGGPAPLAKRVDDLQAALANMSGKIDKMYEIVVTMRR